MSKPICCSKQLSIYIIHSYIICLPEWFVTNLLTIKFIRISYIYCNSTTVNLFTFMENSVVKIVNQLLHVFYSVCAFEFSFT